MKLSEAIKERREPAPRPSGPREIAFHPSGHYTRDDARAIVNQLRNGIPDASATADDLGISLCGLLEGGRFAHCEATYCYPSVQAMRAKAFSTGHGSETRGDNPIPPGATTCDPNDEWDTSRANAKLARAVEYANAATAEFERQQQPAVAAEAMQELLATLRDGDDEDKAAMQEQIAELDQRLRQSGL